MIGIIEIHPAKIGRKAHVCPYLDKDELCSIYDTRPECCRNYPGKGIKYPFTTKEIHSCDSNCSACVDKCCKNVQVPIHIIDPPPEFFIKAHSGSCADCPKTFC